MASRAAPREPEEATDARVGEEKEGAVGKRESPAAAQLKERARLPEVSFRELSIRVHAETNQIVIDVIDAVTKDVIRRIPPEEALALIQDLPDPRALLVDAKG